MRPDPFDYTKPEPERSGGGEEAGGVSGYGLSFLALIVKVEVKAIDCVMGLYIEKQDCR